MKKIYLLAVYLIVSPMFLTAEDTVGTSSALFLKKAVGARAAALGEAYTAIGNDPDAALYNPASLALQKNPELSAMYQTGLADISEGSIMFAYPTGEWGSAGVGLIYADAGSIDVNVTGQKREYKNAQQDKAYVFGYGVKLYNIVSLGIGTKFIQSTLVEDYSDTTNALDGGILIESPVLKGLKVGFSALNMGKGLKYISETDPLPKTYRGGVSYTYIYLTQEEVLYSFLLTADGHKTNDEDTKSGVGCEFGRNSFAMRLGYLLNRDVEGLTAGFGFTWLRFSLDYAFGFVEDFKYNHRVSFHVHFGELLSAVEVKQEKYQHRPKSLGAQ